MHQRWADYRVFWREFRQAYRSTGALLPSGRALSTALTRYVRGDAVDTQAAPSNAGRRILEVGPGTGAVTWQILRDMRPDDRLVLVERNERFVAWLREHLLAGDSLESAGDRVELRHLSVEELPDDEQFDLIISGLPLNNFEAELVELILEKLSRLLAPGGTLSFFEYVGMRPMKRLVSSRAERARLQAVGREFRSFLADREIDRDLVLTNVPPAWVHHVQEARSGERGSRSNAKAFS